MAVNTHPSTHHSLLVHSLLSLLGCWVSLGSMGSLRAQDSDQAAAGQASNRRAIAYYSDAASFQNSGAHKLAIEEWHKLLKEFPDDPLASKAWHYLGVCAIQLTPPNYPEAIDAFTRALQDKKLEIREESLINLSWCQFTQARQAPAGSPAQRAGLEAARDSLTTFLRSYGEGSHLDQAQFYLGEIEYSLGNTQNAIKHYNALLDNKALIQSSLRPEARYAVAVAYEEQELLNQAQKNYQQFATEHADHRLVGEVRVRLADLLLRDGKSAEAEKLLSQINTAPGHSNMADYALLRMGYAVGQQGDTAKAAGYYSQLLKQFPESKHAATAALSLGQILFQKGQLEQAQEQFRSILAAQDNQSAEAAHWLATTLLKQGEPQQAVTMIEESLKWATATPSATSLKMDLADALYAQPDQLEKAQETYESIAIDSPKDPLAPRATYNAAFAALQRGLHADARRLAESFLGNYPQDPLRNDVAYIAAEALLQQGEHAAAAQAYAKLREADPKNPTYQLWTLRLGMAYYLDGEYPSAIELLKSDKTTFETPAQNAEAQFIVGASLLYQEEFPAAIEQLTASHQTDDAWVSADEVLLLLAEAHQRNKDDAAAKQTLQSLLKKYPNSRLKSQVDYKLAQLSAAMSHFEEAIEGYRRIVQDPQAPQYHNFASYGIVWCLMQQDNYQAALDALTPLLEKRLTDSIGSEARLAHGVCLRKVGKTEDAIAALQEYIESQPSAKSLSNARYELGLAYTELRQWDAATTQFEAILAETPDYPAMDKVLYELGWNYQDKGEAATGAKYFNRLVQEFPQSSFVGDATYMLAQQQYDSADYANSAQTYQAVLSSTQDPTLIEKATYKLGWSHFQQERFPQAASSFQSQVEQAPNGPLAVDALFMRAECDFKQEQFEAAAKGYQAAREKLEASTDTAASAQVRTLIYLHAAQCFRELKEWEQCETWLKIVLEQHADSPYMPTALYEMGYCKQNQGQVEEALKYYAEVANNYRDELAARSRFMMGEVYFSQRDFVKAIPEFQRVMFGFGGERAPEDIKNWQAKSAFEAARCSEVLLESLKGNGRQKIIQTAQEFYNFIVEKHAQHDLAAKAQTRLGDLKKLR